MATMGKPGPCDSQRSRLGPYAAGLKKIETRPKPVSYTGTILIHAAARMDSHQRIISGMEPFSSHLQQLGISSYKHLPTGADLPTSVHRVRHWCSGSAVL